MKQQDIIEGIGNDIIYAFGFIFTLVAIIFAWWSTIIDNSIPQPRSPLAAEEQAARQNENIAQSDSNVDLAQSSSLNSPPLNHSSPLAEDHFAPNLSSFEEPEQTLRFRSSVATPAASQDANTRDENSFTVRLKYLDDTQRDVVAHNNETVENFRRRCFPSNNNYRMVFRGRILRDENTLNFYGIQPPQEVDNDSDPVFPVVHCFLNLSSNTTSTTNSNNNEEEQRQNRGSFSPSAILEDMSISHLFMPLLGLVILGLWYVCLFQSHLITLPAVVNVIGLTCFYLILIVNHFT